MTKSLRFFLLNCFQVILFFRHLFSRDKIVRRGKKSYERMHWRVVQREDECFIRTVALFVMFNWKGLVQKSWAWKKEWLNIKMERTGFFSRFSSIFQTLSLVEYSIRAWNGLPIMSNSKHEFFSRWIFVGSEFGRF